LRRAAAIGAVSANRVGLRQLGSGCAYT
jgi:hypothetical protein